MTLGELVNSLRSSVSEEVSVKTYKVRERINRFGNNPITDEASRKRRKRLPKRLFNTDA